MENNSNSSGLKAGLILALAIAAFFGFLYFKEKKTNAEMTSEIKSKTQDVVKVTSKLDSLGNEVHIKINELAAMGGRIEELEEIRINLENDKKRLSSTQNINWKEINQKIKNYERLIQQKDTELQRYKAENAIIKQENSDLGVANTNLQNSNSRLNEEKSALTDTVKQIVKINRDLQEKVTLGAALRPVNYSVTAINKRGKNREGEEFKSRRVDQIKVSFKLAENSLTKQENKTIFMRLLDPNGNVISDMALGSGVFIFGGKETVYTSKQVVNYTNSNQTVEFAYDRESKYERGKYKVEFYAEGFRVGQTTFTIK